MSHVHGGHAQGGLQLHDLRAGLHAQLGIQVGQGLIHEEHLRLADNGASHGHALALTAGEILGLAIQELLQAQSSGSRQHALLDFRLGGLSHLEGETHVLFHAHVWVEGVILEHHGDIALFGLSSGDILATDGDASTGGVLQPSESAQGGGFAAARGPDQHQELSIGNLEVKILHRGAFCSGVLDRHMVEFHV